MCYLSGITSTYAIHEQYTPWYWNMVAFLPTNKLKKTKWKQQRGFLNLNFFMLSEILKKFFCFCQETLELISRWNGATWPRYYTSKICTLQCERGQHITVTKLDLLTWGVLLARVLVKTDVSREESMISSYIFPATVHAAPPLQREDRITWYRKWTKKHPG